MILSSLDSNCRRVCSLQVPSPILKIKIIPDAHFIDLRKMKLFWADEQGLEGAAYNVARVQFNLKIRDGDYSWPEILESENTSGQSA